jgi:uncharacterized phage protein gp47/JayE
MSSVTADGFQCDDIATILTGLQAAMRNIFGQDIDVGNDTVDGETLQIYAEAKVDSDQLALDVYNSWNPQTASGVALSRLVELNGIRRIPAEPSQITVTCSGNVNTHIPIGSIIESTANGERFVTIQDAVVPWTGAIEVACFSQNYGAIQGPVGTLTTIITPVFGWQSVTNSTSAILGRDMETDAELRIRRAMSTATPAQSVPESLYGAIANIPLVTQVRIFENNSGEVSKDEMQMPPHSYMCVVEGGADLDIAGAIWNRASIGAQQVGHTTVTIQDVQGYPHDITFQRPEIVRMYVRIWVRPLPGWGDALVAAITQNLVNWTIENWRIGQDIIYSRVYEPLNELPNVFSVTALYVGPSSGTTNTQDYHLYGPFMATLDPADITVTVLS